MAPRIGATAEKNMTIPSLLSGLAVAGPCLVPEIMGRWGVPQSSDSVQHPPPQLYVRAIPVPVCITCMHVKTGLV